MSEPSVSDEGLAAPGRRIPAPEQAVHAGAPAQTGPVPAVGAPSPEPVSAVHARPEGVAAALEPELSIPGLMNFRDTGGLRAGSSMTRHGVLFRSAHLARVGEQGRERLRALGLRRIIDLRADEEVLGDPTRLDDLGLEMLRVPLFRGSAASFLQDDWTLANLYRGLVDDSADRIVEVVRGVISATPVLVHCTVGKDRTGVTVALTLAAAGVDEDAVVADYARTESLLPAERNAQIVAYLRREHPGSANLEELATRSPAPVMRGMLDDLRARFGAPVEFLRANGLADDEIAELRRVLVAPSSS